MLSDATQFERTRYTYVPFVCYGLNPVCYPDTVTMDASRETRVAAIQGPSDEAQPPIFEIDAEHKALAQRVLRKIDWRLIPLMFITYNLNFMDKTILSSAAVFGLREDNVSMLCEVCNLSST